MAYDKDRQLAIDFLKRELERFENYCIQTKYIISMFEGLQKEGLDLSRSDAGTTRAEKRRLPENLQKEDTRNIQSDNRSASSLAIEIITKANRFLHSSEIRDAINKQYKDINAYYAITVLSRAKKTKKVIAKIPLEDSMKTSYFGLKEWLDENGEIKPAYKPN